MSTSRALLIALTLSGLPAAARAQTTLQLDDGTMEQMWRLTSPNAGPGDWVGVAYDPPFEHPFRVVSATMFYLDNSCCIGSNCSNAWCLAGSDWERRVIAPANTNVDSAGLTPNINAPVLSQSNLDFPGAGSNRTATPWTLTPEVWTLPANTIFDHPGRIFYAIKYWNTDPYMNFAVDSNGPFATNGFGVYTNNSFATRSNIWVNGNVGMRLLVQRIFFAKLASTQPQPSFALAGQAGVTMLALRMSAGASATTITRVRVSGSGTGHEVTGITSVRLVVDSNRNGAADLGEPTLATATFAANDGVAELNFSRSIAANANEEWLVVYDFSQSPAGGDTFTARVNAASDVTSSQGAPYMSGTAGGTGIISGSAVTVAGRLVASRGPTSPPARIVSAGAQNVPTLQVRLTADNEAFSVTRLALSADGTLNDVTGVQSVRLYLDADSSGTLTGGDTLLASGTFPADDGRLDLGFAAVAIPRNQSRDLLAVYDLAPGSTGGQTFRTLVPSAGDVVASGVFSGPIPATGPRALAGTPVIGNVATVGGALTVSLGAATPPNGTAQPGVAGVPMLQLTASAQAEAVNLAVLTFTASGTGHEVNHLTRARLFRDVNGNGLVDAGDVLLGTPQSYAADDGIVTFALAGETVPANGARSYLVAYDLAATPTGGETFRVSLASAGAVSASGAASGAPITATGSFPLQGRLLTLLGGLSATAGPQSPPAGNVQPGRVDVPVLQLQLAAQGESFTASSLRVVASGSLDDLAGVAAVRVWRDLGTPGVRDAADVLLASGTFDADDGQRVFTFSPPLPLTAGSTERWLVTYDLTLAALPGQTFRATVPAAGLVATGSLSGPAAVAGLPAASEIHRVGGGLTLSAGPANPTGGVIEPSATGVTMLQLRLAADLEPITVSGITVRASGSGNEVTAITRARLFVDTNGDGALDVGDTQLGAQQTFGQNDGPLTFSFAGRTLAAGTAETWMVVYDFGASASAGETFQLGFLADTDVAAQAPSGLLPRGRGAPVSGGARTVLGRLAATRGPQSPAARVVPRNATDVAVLQLRLAGVQESFTVSSLRLQAAGSLDDVGDLAGVTLLLDADSSGTRTPGDTVLAGPVAFGGDDGLVTFGGLSLAIAAGQARDLLVVVDLAGTAAGGATFRVSLPTAAEVVASGFGGRAVSVAGLPISSETLTMGGTFQVGLGAQSPIARVVRRGEAGVEALQLRLTAETEPVTLTGLTLHATGSGDDAAGLAAVQLYLDADGDGRVGPGEPQLGSGTFSADNGSLAFILSQAVQVGPALHLLARVSLSNAPVGGDTFRLGLAPQADVQITSQSGAVVITGVAVQGALLTTGGGFQVALGPQSSPGGVVNQAAQNVAVMQLDVQAVNEACTVHGLTLRAAGSLHDQQDVTRVRLLRDVNDNGLVDFADAPLGSPATFSDDDGTVSFAGLGRTLGMNASERWLVVFDLSGNGSHDNTFRVRLEDARDLVVSCSISGPVTAAGPPLESGIFTLQEDGALVLARGSQTPPATFVRAGQVRVAALQVRAAASVQPVTLETLVLTASTTPSALSGVDLFLDVNQDGRLDRNDTLLAAGGAPDAQGRVAFPALNLAIPITEARFLLAAVNVDPQAPPGTRFSLGIARELDATARSPVGQALTTGTPIAGNVLTVAGNLNVAAGTPGTVHTVNNDDGGLVVLDLILEAGWERFHLRSLTVTTEGTMAASSAVRGLALVSDEDRDGAAGATDRWIAERVTFPQGASRTSFSGLAEALEPGQPRRFLVVVDLDGRARVDQTLTFSLAADVDLLAEGDRLGISSPVGAPVVGQTLRIGPSLVLGSGPVRLEDQIVPANAKNVPVLQLSASAFNEDVTVSRLTLGTSGSLDAAQAVEAVRLFSDVNGNGRVDREDVEVTAPSRPTSSDGRVSFAPLAELIGQNAGATYLVTVDLSGSGVAGQELRFELASDADVTAFGTLSGAVAATGAPLVGPRLSLVGALNVRLGAASPPGAGVHPGATFPLLQLELFTRGEPVAVEQLALRLGGSAEDARDIAEARLWVDVDGNGLADGEDYALGTARPDGDDGMLVFRGLGFSIPADGRLWVLAELDLAEDAAPGGTVRASLAENGDLRASGSVTGPITAVGAPIAGDLFSIVARRGGDPGGGMVAEGCGCSAAEARPAGSAWFGLALGLLPLVRRRRR